MFDRITETFVEIDDFCKQFLPQWENYLIGEGKSRPSRGPEGIAESEIMTILIMYHSGGFKYFKNFYNGFILEALEHYFPKLPSYNRFLELVPKVMVPMIFFLNSKMGKKTGIYYIDSTPLPVCHKLRVNRHKVFKGLANHGRSSTGWFFGLKLHLVFNHQHEIIALKITPGNVHDTKPVKELTKDLCGKLFGDKGYLGKNLVNDLLKRGLHLITRVRKNMKSLPMFIEDKILLNARNMAETIIGKIKEFSSLNLPKHRSVINAFVHICAAVVSYQLNPLKPRDILLLTLK